MLLKLFYTISILVTLGITAGCNGTSTDAGLNGSSGSSGSGGVSANSGTNGAVTLNWLPPTQNTNGSPLTNLAGYKIYYGTSPGQVYSNSVSIQNPGLSSYVIENLSNNTTYYFVITSVNGFSIESAYSNMASKNITG